MKPCNEELRAIYTQKRNKAQQKITEVQIFYSQLSEPSDLQSEILLIGCKVMITNLKGHIVHCNNQINKYTAINSN